MLEIRDLEAGYGRIRILHGVSLAVPGERITALLGANGAGKTTLMRSIAPLPSVLRISPMRRAARSLMTTLAAVMTLLRWPGYTQISWYPALESS